MTVKLDMNVGPWVTKANIAKKSIEEIEKEVKQLQRTNEKMFQKMGSTKALETERKRLQSFITLQNKKIERLRKTLGLQNAIIARSKELLAVERTAIRAQAKADRLRAAGGRRAVPFRTTVRPVDQAFERAQARRQFEGLEGVSTIATTTAQARASKENLKNIAQRRNAIKDLSQVQQDAYMQEGTLSSRAKKLQKELAETPVGTKKWAKLRRESRKLTNEFKRLHTPGGKLKTMFVALGRSIAHATIFIAAALFVITGFVSIMKMLLDATVRFLRAGADIPDLVAQIGISFKQSAGEMANFARQTEDIRESSGKSQKEVNKGYRELRKLGLSTNKAMALLPRTLALTRIEGIKTADAAKIAAFNIYGLNKEYGDLSKLTDTARSAWQRFTETFKSFASAFYTKEEPRFIKWLDDLSNWINLNEDKLLSIASSFLSIAEAMAKISAFPATLAFGSPSGTPEGMVWNTEQEKFISKAGLVYSQTKGEYVPRKEKAYLGGSEIYSPSSKTGPGSSKFLSALFGTKPTFDIPKIPTRSFGKPRDPADYPETVGMDRRVELYKSTLKKLGLMGEKSREKEKLDLIDYYADLARIEGPAFSERIRSYDDFINKWSDKSKEMRAGQEFFRATGIIDPKQFGLEVAKIQETVAQKEDYLTPEQMKIMTGRLLSQFATRQRAPGLRPHEAILKDTGIMTEQLYAERSRRIAVAETRARDLGVDPATAAKQAQVKFIKLDTEKNAAVLAGQQGLFEATGVVRENYVKAQKNQFERMRKLQVKAHGMSYQDSLDYYDRLVKDFEGKLIQPQIDAYSQFAETSFVYDDKLFELKKENLLRYKQFFLDVTGDVAAANQLHYDQLNNLEIERLYKNRTIMGGMRKTFKDYGDSATNTARNVSQAVTIGFRSMESALTEFVTKGKLDFKSLADSIIEDLTRIAIRQSITGVFANVLGSYFSPGGSNAGTSPYNPNNPNIHRAGGGSVSPYSSYIVGEKGPEILSMGSRGGNITANNKIGGAPPVQVVVNNNTGKDTEVRQDEPQFDGQKWVVGIWLDAYQRNAHGLRTVMGG